MFSEELESVIEAALADGALTAKEREVLHKRAAAEGVDPDELDVVIEGRLAKMKREEDWLRPAPPSDKFGDVKKCPNCGEPVEPMAVKCSACGYEFRNVEALKSSQRLAEKLEAIDEAYRGKKIEHNVGFGMKEDRTIFEVGREQVTAIKSFPVPTTKEDLLDFAISMQSKWKSSTMGDDQLGLKSAYKAKYDECVNKAQILFPNDPMFQGVFEQYQADKKNIWANMSTSIKILLGVVLFFLFSYIIFKLL
jgi:hypothetical protein